VVAARGRLFIRLIIPLLLFFLVCYRERHM
jgi:hypothetical protein